MDLSVAVAAEEEEGFSESSNLDDGRGGIGTEVAAVAAEMVVVVEVGLRVLVVVGGLSAVDDAGGGGEEGDWVFGCLVFDFLDFLDFFG